MTFEIYLKVTQFAYYKIFAILKNYSNNLILKCQALKALSAAFGVEVERVECPLKTPTSTPETVNTFLIHPDMVELTTGLWGWTKLKRSWHSSEVLHFSDLLRYSFKTSTTHKLLSSLKEWKTTAGGDFSFFHALWSFWKVKVKLLGVFIMNLMFRCCKPSAREADIRAYYVWT